MLINLLINFVLLCVGLLFVFLPVVTIADIPYIGTTVSTLLAEMVSYWYAVMDTIPYFQIVWDVLIIVIIPFEVLMLCARFFLGSHLPTHNE